MFSRISRSATSLIASGVLAFGVVGFVGINSASATPVHTGCSSVYNEISSGWCNLYPGNASNNVKDLAQMALSNNQSLLTIQTKSVATGAAPRTSFACITLTPADQITHRLQETQCKAEGGVWITWTGASKTIDMTQYPQFSLVIYTVQVAANDNAGNGNGDAFYNGFTVWGFGVG